MIERLTTSLGVLSRMSGADVASEDGRQVAADCADAIRLELDCPQQDLSREQRATLESLGDAIEDRADGATIATLAAATRRALGLEPP